jgi:hypothetical protein
MFGSADQILGFCRALESPAVASRPLRVSIPNAFGTDTDTLQFLREAVYRVRHILFTSPSARARYVRNLKLELAPPLDGDGQLALAMLTLP